jgi:hypothetical protein
VPAVRICQRVLHRHPVPDQQVECAPQCDNRCWAPQCLGCGLGVLERVQVGGREEGGRGCHVSESVLAGHHWLDYIFYVLLMTASSADDGAKACRGALVQAAGCTRASCSDTSTGLRPLYEPSSWHGCNKAGCWWVLAGTGRLMTTCVVSSGRGGQRKGWQRTLPPTSSSMERIARKQRSQTQPSLGSCTAYCQAATLFRGAIACLVFVGVPSREQKLFPAGFPCTGQGQGGLTLRSQMRQSPAGR